MRNQPEKIYLNVGFDKAEYDVDFNSLSEVTWSVFKEYDADIEYVKAPQWIKINSEADLPIEDTTYYMGKFLNGKFHFSADEVELDDILEYYQDWGFTHYMPITKPKPPIY